MRLGTIAFLAGVSALQFFTALPDTLLVTFLLVCAVPLFFCKAWRLPVFVLLGFFWACLRADLILGQGLAPQLEGESVQVVGTVDGIPEKVGNGALRFRFEVEELRYRGQVWPSPGRVRLSWYRDAREVEPGQKWRLSVRLKRPWGFMNPGGFDYEKWLFRQGIRATGYIAGPARLLSTEAGQRVNRLRYRVGTWLDSVLEKSPLKGLVLALSIGVRDSISPDQWNVLTRTGTGHLMAISGLHIGLVAGFAFFLGRWLWSVATVTTLYLPAPRFGAIAAIAAACAYAALAGFSVPTQRALIMLTVFMGGILFARRAAPLDLLTLALIVVLIIDPLAVLSPGFWLSFGAVAVIAYSMSARLGPFGIWWRYVRVQWVVAIGLTPLLIVLFGQNPLLGVPANLIAVPWVSLVVVPLVLTSVLFELLFDGGRWLLDLAEGSLALIWPFLEWIAGFDFAVLHTAINAWWTVIPAILAILVMLMPHGIPGRTIGVICLLPLMFSQPASPANGALWFTLLDVGQGLAAVVRTKHHTLVYDVGARFSERFDAGTAVLVPYLRHFGIDSVDLVVISHGDNDHIGGLRGLLSAVYHDSILTSVPGKIDSARVSSCQSGQHWNWDGVTFEVLHPSVETPARDNDGSCVIRISTAESSVLLTGDIEGPAERELLRRARDRLEADILVVPHHGSRTSSSAAFIDAVDPAYALFPVGYRNRFGFPRPAVAERYRATGTKLLDTAQGGALSFYLHAGELRLESYRSRALRYWHSRPVSKQIPSAD